MHSSAAQRALLAFAVRQTFVRAVSILTNMVSCPECRCSAGSYRRAAPCGLAKSRQKSVFSCHNRGGGVSHIWRVPRLTRTFGVNARRIYEGTRWAEAPQLTVGGLWRCRRQNDASRGEKVSFVGEKLDIVRVFPYFGSDLFEDCAFRHTCPIRGSRVL